MISRKHVRLLVMALALIFFAARAGLADPPQAMCAMGPLKCPDGTYVFPGPGCTFGPCPGKPLPAPDQDTSGAQKSENGGNSKQDLIEDGQSTEHDDHGNIIIDRDHATDTDEAAPPSGKKE